MAKPIRIPFQTLESDNSSQPSSESTSQNMNIQEQMSKLNSYTARVDRAHPTAFVFLIDQSGSMGNTIEVEQMRISKAALVAQSINRIIDEILNRCTKPDEVREYFDIALIGYGSSSNEANLIIKGNASNKGWLKPKELRDAAKYRKEVIKQTIRGVEREKEIDTPYWIEPTSAAATPMRSAFRMAKGLLEEWCRGRIGQDCYPPVVINITDGVATDATEEQMIEIANEVKEIHTIDGNVLVFNIHLSSDKSEGVVFPTDESQVGNKYSQMLYKMSSKLPKLYNNDIKAMVNRDANGGYRAMGYNASVDFVRMLNIGTITNMANDEE